MSFHPRTPQSPSQLSPKMSSDQMAATSSSVPPAGSGTGTGTGTVALPTPAHSVNGSSSHLDSAMPDETPHKRKRSLDDTGDREQKKVHLEDRKLSIEDLHLDVGEKYLLCQTRHPEPLPRVSEDLYDMFGLADLAAEVAREKPNGEKNALRKTYKGHIKRLGVAGHFDVQKKKEDAPSDFMAMLQVPELEWNVHQVKGREISDGPSKAMLANLDRAMTMSKGPVPKAIWDTSVLGDLAPSNAVTSKSIPARPSAPNTPSASNPNAAARPTKPQAPPGHDPNRPRRNGKKRSYGDSSFEGYGEGFPDDDGGLDTGYSTGEGEGGQKRRKKNSPDPILRRQSYGPGMVGA